MGWRLFMFVRALVFSILAFPLFGYSANIVINPVTGFSDATATDPIGGNPGKTLGAQRLNTFQKAADILGKFLEIKIDLEVDASFKSLACTATSGTLGSAGPISIFKNTKNAPLADTWYPIALANNLASYDYLSEHSDIKANFNADLDNNSDCVNGVNWYYGYDDPTSEVDYENDISFLSVVIHELLHGLGVSSLVSSEGALRSGYMDAYSANLYDQEVGKSWSAMNDSERKASITNTDNLVWTGPNVNTSAAALALTDGMNTDKVEMFAPSPYEGGSSVSHFSTSATPNELMEPRYTDFLTTPGMATQLLQDLGWAIVGKNSPPILAPIGSLASVEDNNVEVTLSATDADGDTPTFSARSNNTSVTASISGTTLTLTPDANYFGSADITVIANDGTGTANATDTETIIYTVSSENDLPVFTSTASGSIQYGNNLEVTLAATDVETANNAITYSVQSSNSSQVTASLAGTTLTLAPVNNYIGDTTLILIANDTNGGTTDQSYVLTISNTAPVFSSSENLTTLYSNKLAHSLTANDANSDELTFNLRSHDSNQVMASLTGSTLTLHAANDFTGNTSIKVSVDDGNISVSQTIILSIYDDFSLVSSNGTLSQGDSLGVSNSSFEFSLGGGDNNYNVDVVFDGQDLTHELLTLSAGSYFLAMPESGAFAGDYTITITDSNGETADFTIQRPLKVTANIDQLISNSVTQEMYIEGAPAGSILDLYINNDAGLVDLKINNTIITQVEAPDNANSFNRAVVQLDVNDFSATRIINISSDSAVLPAGEVNLTLLPFHDLALTVTDLSGIGISTGINIDDDRFVVWGLNQQLITDNSGTLALALPTDQVTSISLNAENYQARTVEISAQLNQLTLELELLENPMTVSGSITTSTLNFINENPIVQLIAIDGSVMTAELSALSSGSVDYSITINKLAFEADKLTITIGDINQEIRLINNQIDSTINININAPQIQPVIETSSAGGNSYLLIFLLLLLVNYSKRKTS
jgi:hypothetical protein